MKNRVLLTIGFGFLFFVFFCITVNAATVDYAVNLRDDSHNIICCIYPGASIEVIGTSSTNPGRTDVVYNGVYGSILSDAVSYSESYDDSNDESSNYDYVHDGIEIDLSNQILNVWDENTLLYQTSIVSGMQNVNDTPTGTFYIYSKVNGRYLNGYNSDGSTYSQWVDYWMPFYLGYGIHDAGWRSSFGGDIYTYSGSHGCVNLPPSAAADIFYLVEVGTKVYIHY